MDQFLNTFLNWDYIWQVFPDLIKTGLLNTLILAVTSALIGTAVGMFLAVVGLSAKPWLRWPARVYTDIFRGLPADRRRKGDAMTVEAQRRSSSVELRDIHVSFGTLEVLRGVDLKVEKGRTTWVIGPSGSGKSTLLRCVNRLQEPDSGDLLLSGESVIKADPDRLRQRVGMVFQHFNLFGHRTVLDNITVPLRSVKGVSKGEATESALARLDEVGLADKAPYRPAALSGGQQQRVAIARALAMDPEVMLFDEATSALDPELVKGVLNLMAGLAERGLTLIVVTHEMGFARRVADEVAFMDRGKVVETGTPDALFDSPESRRLRRFLSQVL
jgi:polar amino acid transport system ATP-binding protein